MMESWLPPSRFEFRWFDGLLENWVVNLSVQSSWDVYAVSEQEDNGIMNPF